MPEGDTIYRTAQTLHRAIASAQVTRFESAYAHLNRIDIDRPIVGRTVESVSARGKHLLIQFSGGLVLRTHMRMSGRWHVYGPGERWRAASSAVRIVIGTPRAVAVALDVVDAEFREPDHARRPDVVATLGPDLLSDPFDEDVAVAAIRACGERAIADVLLDQRVISGAGNVFKSEILFVSRVNPWMLARSLDADHVRAIVRAARKLLVANATRQVHGRAWRSTTGRLHPAEQLWVYGRRGRPCLRCGTAIAYAKQGIGARSTFWCPRCQPGPGAGVTDVTTGGR